MPLRKKAKNRLIETCTFGGVGTCIASIVGPFDSIIAHLLPGTLLTAFRTTLVFHLLPYAPLHVHPLEAQLLLF